MLRNMPFEPRELTDPMAMRALAHPVRLALLEALADAGGPLTATEAAERVGESPSSCSFHLRQLAKYGFVEEAGGGEGRRRPWKLSHTGMTWGGNDDDPERALAANALERMMRHRFLARAEQAMESRASLPKAWRELTGTSQFLLYATPKELEAIDREQLELLTRFQDRIADASKRPRGARAFELIQLAYPIDRLTP
jgi:DNA-binding transcriptional ArsR family regulator